MHDSHAFFISLRPTVSLGMWFTHATQFSLVLWDLLDVAGQVLDGNLYIGQIDTHKCNGRYVYCSVWSSRLDLLHASTSSWWQTAGIAQTPL